MVLGVLVTEAAVGDLLIEVFFNLVKIHENSEEEPDDE
jgi:hypothetical protein